MRKTWLRIALISALCLALMLALTACKCKHKKTESAIENDVAATCAAEGSHDEVEYCKKCGEELSRTTIYSDKLAHTPGEWTTVTEPTCHAEGEKHKACSVCGENLETESINKIAHTPAAAVRENEVAPTCTVDGSYDEVVYCSVEACGAEISREAKTISTPGHTPGTPVVENSEAANCFTGGSYDEVIYCSVVGCGHEISRTPKTVPATGAHIPAAAVRENEVAATCTVDGSYDEVVYCSVIGCDAEISRNPHVVNKPEHNFAGASIEVEACGVEGAYSIGYCIDCKTFVEPNADIVLHAHKYVAKSTSTSYWFECELCGHIIDASETYHTVNSAHDHDYNLYTLEPPTCTEDGLGIYTCTKCSFVMRDIIPALGHNFVEIEILDAATCTEDGERLCKCTRCGVTKNETISAPGHRWDSGTVVEASLSCLDPGIKKYTCYACGAEKEEEYFANHDFSEFECIQEESCTTTGIYKRVCSVCGVEEYDYVLPRHDFDEGVIIQYPTCTEVGKRLLTCLLCGHEEIEDINELDHNWDTVAQRAVTCTADGYAIKICTRCRALQYVHEDALGHNLSWKYDDSNHWKECSRCEYETELGAHTIELVVGTEAVDTGAEIFYRYVLKDACAKCGYEHIYDTSELHIHYGAEVIPATYPTCTEGGYLPGLKCAVAGCGEILVEQAPADPLGHNWYGCVCTRCGETLLEMELSSDETYYIVKGMGEYTGTILNIPATYKGIPVKEVTESAFEDCTALTSVTIPESITNINRYAFDNCTDLEEIYFNAVAMSDLSSNDYVFRNAGQNGDGIKVVIGKNVTKVPAYLFCPYSYSSSYSPKIVSVEFEEGSICENIGEHAFAYCDSLTSITIPNSVTSIGGSAFKGCSRLASIVVNEGNTTYKNIGGNHLYTKDGKTLIQYAVGSDATNFTIPNSVTSIGEYAFYNCTDLSSVTIPDTVETLGTYAFAYCSNLSELTLGNSLTTIGDGAFNRCTGLTSVTIPNSVTSIGDDAFSGCTGLTSVTIPNSITSIGDDAFENCYGLTSVTIGSGVTSIGDSAFYYCTGLTSVTIPDTVETLGTYAFAYCSNLSELTLGNSLTTIGNYALYRCTALTSVTIGNGVTSIGWYAFEGCTGLTSITIPDSVTSIGGYAFRGCTGVIVVDNGVSYVDKWVIDCDESVTSVTLRYDTVGIADYAFDYCTGLTSITIPNSVTTIGVRAFSNCTGLKSVTIPNSVTSIGNEAFYSCDGLTSVTIGSGVTSIGGYAFSGCTALEEIYFNAVAMNDLVSYYNYVFYNAGQSGDGIKVVIGKNVTKIPAYLFCPYSSSPYAPKIVIVEFEEGSVCESIGEYAFAHCDGLTSITIPNSVTTIGVWAFDDCTGLTNVTIPNSVTSIGQGAFRNCTGLTSVTIGCGVTRIGVYAFYNCTALEEIYFNAAAMNDLSYNDYVFSDAGKNGDGIKVIIGKNVTKVPAYLFRPYQSSSNLPKIVSVEFEEGSVCESIGESAFYGCIRLTSITIPNRVTSIGNNAFSGCTALEEIYFNAAAMNDLSYNDYVFSDAGKNGDGIKVIIGKNVTKIPAYLFQNNGYIASVEFEEGSVCESIGNTAFAYCSDLTSIAIPNSVTSIDSAAFYGCTSLTSVTIPRSVTSIGEHVFGSCTGLTSVTIPNSVTSIGWGAFYDCTALEKIYFNAVAMNDLSSDNYVFSNAGKNGDGIKVVIGKDVTKIPAYLFRPSGSSYLPKIVSVEFEEGSVCESIGNHAFEDCTGLTNITIPDSVTSIGNYAFTDCTGLTSVTIGEGVTSIGVSAFSGCTRLTAVYITDIAAWCGISFGNYSANNPLYYAKNLYLIEDGEAKLITNLVIPEGVTSVGNYAFCNCTSLTSVTIPNSLTSIGIAAFYGCTGLTSVTIPNSVTSIGIAAFYGCTGLKSVTIGNSVTSIGSSAFNGCTGLTSVTIGSGVTRIGGLAFYDCTALEEIYFNAVAMNDLDSYNNYVFYNAGQSGVGIKVVIGKNVTKVPAYLFCPSDSSGSSYSPKIVSVEFEEGSACESIGNYAFYYCTALESVEISDSVTSIGERAFCCCTGLTSVSIAKGVTSIGDSAFYRCTRLTSVTIPDSVTSIGNYAFEYCTRLTAVYITDIAAWCGISFGDTYANPLCYAGNLYLIEDGEAELITDLVIPDGVTSIGNYAFEYCTGLTSVTIPDSVTSIGSYAFYRCTGLTSVNFADPNGWWYASSSTATSGTGISASDLANTSTAATYLNSTYYNYYWKKS